MDKERYFAEQCSKCGYQPDVETSEGRDHLERDKDAAPKILPDGLVKVSDHVHKDCGGIVRCYQGSTRYIDKIIKESQVSH